MPFCKRAHYSKKILVDRMSANCVACGQLTRAVICCATDRKFGSHHLFRWTGHGEDTPRHDSRKVATIRLRLGSLQESDECLTGDRSVEAEVDNAALSELRGV